MLDQMLFNNVLSVSRSLKWTMRLAHGHAWPPARACVGQRGGGVGGLYIVTVSLKVQTRATNVNGGLKCCPSVGLISDTASRPAGSLRLPWGVVD